MKRKAHIRKKEKEMLNWITKISVKFMHDFTSSWYVGCLLVCFHSHRRLGSLTMAASVEHKSRGEIFFQHFTNIFLIFHFFFSSEFTQRMEGKIFQFPPLWWSEMKFSAPAQCYSNYNTAAKKKWKNSNHKNCTRSTTAASQRETGENYVN